MGDRRRQVALVGSYASRDDPGIHVVAIDASGALARQGAVGGIENPSYLCVAPDRRHLYAVSETGLVSDGAHGAVVALRIEHSDDGVDLIPVSRRSTGGDHPCHVAIDPSGRWIVAVNYGSGEVVVVPIAADGSLGEPTASVRHEGRGHDPGRQAGPHPHGSAFSPDGHFVLVADLGIDQIVVYALDTGDGTLSPHAVFDAAPGSGPRQLAFHPDGEVVFLVNELDCTLTALAWDPDAGTLHDIQTVSTLPGGVTGPNLAAAVCVAPSGRHVHVSTRGADIVTTFSFGRASGLEVAAVRPSDGMWPRDITLTPGGEGLLVANEHSGEVVALPVDVATGTVGTPSTSARIPGPSAIVILPGT